MNINRLTFIGSLSFLILGVAGVCTAASSPTAAIKKPFEQIKGCSTQSNIVMLKH